MKKKVLTSVLLSALVLTPLVGFNQAFAEEAKADISVAEVKEDAQPVTVKYVDKSSGVEIAEHLVLKGDLGTRFVVEQKEIENYDYIGSNEALEGVFTAQEQVVTLAYEKKEVPVAKGTLTVEYVDEAGKAISDTETKTENVGTAYNIPTKEIKGYTFSKVKEGNQVGTFTEAAQKLVLEYKKDIKKSSVTVKYVDENNKEIKKSVIYSVNEGEKVALDEFKIEGYEFVSGPSEVDYKETPQTVTHRYKKIKQGPYIKDGSYVKISKKGYSTYSNFDWKQKDSSSNLYGKMFEARGRYEHANGATYYSLYDNKGEWYGYINSDATTKAAPEGPYISDGRIVKVTNKNYASWSNFNWDKRNDGSELFGKTFKARGRYEHFNGNTYYSLYDAKGKWYGYINKAAVSNGEEQGSYISDGSYVKISKKNYSMWQNFNWNKKGSTNDVYGETLQAKGRYEHFNGSTYYSLYDVKGVWYGYLNVDATTPAVPQGEYISDGRYVKIEKLGYNIFSDFNWTVRNTSDALRGDTFKAKGRYEHINGNTYYSMYDAKDNWQGYVDAKAVSIVTNPEGNYIRDGRYVTVDKKGYNVWSNFNWKFRNKSEELMGVTLEARGRYEHADGNTYYSLYDLGGVWQGYLDAAATTSTKAEGKYISDGSYVKVSKKGIDVYSNFNWTVKSKSDSLFDKVYQARGRYEHANKTTYYSLYDNAGVWQGYLEAGAVSKITSPQGEYISDGRYFKVSNKGFDVWGSFKENKINTSDQLYGKLYQARGRYEHVNGNTYYSLYDNDGKWQGYVDGRAGLLTKAQGPYISDGSFVTITSKNYNIYSNFDWKVVMKSSQVYGKTFKARGRYQHFNGNTYYSLFDGEKWIGYINADAAKLNN
ncbi:MucBP domain-containing protein [Vagococcus sp.]|uniref:MucBP domain-containing protein n=1 Tax=Vagococcus sp. TaxID=1933889 RepID=UPI002FC9B72E